MIFAVVPFPSSLSIFISTFMTPAISFATDKPKPKPPVFLVLAMRSEEHTSELQSRFDLVCRLLLAKQNAGSADQVDGHPCGVALARPHPVRASSLPALARPPPPPLFPYTTLFRSTSPTGTPAMFNTAFTGVGLGAENSA